MKNGAIHPPPNKNGKWADGTELNITCNEMYAPHFQNGTIHPSGVLSCKPDGSYDGIPLCQSK